METTAQPNLIDSLRDLKRRWDDATGAAPTRLGRIVCNDGDAIARLANEGTSITLAKLEQFATFLADAENWPEGDVPEEAVAFAHRVGVSVTPAAASIGQSDGMSGERSAA
ncbi:MAG: hypothetical protein CL955_03950 [Erythrobacteraceae bacterium]|mgnify:CR=1 FL=1|nr:hypothetical protein [Erythrobacteraceae bacterium]